MTSSQFVGYRLNNYASVIAIVSTRIYFGYLPETEITLPSINYNIISAPNLWGNVERERYQISCRAINPETCKELAFQVRRAFNNLQDTINTFDVQMCWFENITMILEPDNIYHIPVDFFITYIRT
jgi:hypothetical protein